MGEFLTIYRISLFRPFFDGTSCQNACNKMVKQNSIRFGGKSGKSLTITVYIGHTNWIFFSNGKHPVYVLMVHK